MKRERFQRMSTLLAKVLGPSVTALVLSAGSAPAQASSCLDCKILVDSIGTHYYCGTMWWYESGGSISCWVDSTGCNTLGGPWGCS